MRYARLIAALLLFIVKETQHAQRFSRSMMFPVYMQFRIHWYLSHFVTQCRCSTRVHDQSPRHFCHCRPNNMCISKHRTDGLWHEWKMMRKVRCTCIVYWVRPEYWKLLQHSMNNVALVCHSKQSQKKKNILRIFRSGIVMKRTPWNSTQKLQRNPKIGANEN